MLSAALCLCFIKHRRGKCSFGGILRERDDILSHGSWQQLLAYMTSTVPLLSTPPLNGFSTRLKAFFILRPPPPAPAPMSGRDADVICECTHIIWLCVIYGSLVASVASTSFPAKKFRAFPLCRAERTDERRRDRPRSNRRRPQTTTIRGASVISCMTKLQRQRGF